MSDDTTTPLSVDEIIAGVTRPQRDVPLCLDAALAMEHQIAIAELAAARGGARKLAGADTGALTERVNSLTERAKASTVVFTFRGLPFREFNRLVLAHPPRAKNKGDEVGFNTLTFWPALIAASLVNPVMTAEQIDRFIDQITDGQLDALATAAHAVNRTDGTRAPFFAAGSGPATASPETSR